MLELSIVLRFFGVITGVMVLVKWNKEYPEELKRVLQFFEDLIFIIWAILGVFLYLTSYWIGGVTQVLACCFGLLFLFGALTYLFSKNPITGDKKLKFMTYSDIIMNK